LRRVAILCAIAATTVIPSASAATRAGFLHTRSSLSCSGAISWQKASSLVGRVATIQGTIAGTHYATSSNGSPTFLNIGADYPSPSRFTALIWSESRAAFGRPEVRYRGHTVCVHGLVSTYQGVPEVVLRTVSQIKIIR
jgi:DNA/RNA endonuclease YhcR with UshA esterase domain